MYFFICVLWTGVIFDNAARTFTDPRRTMRAQFGDTQFQYCLDWVVQNARPNDVVVCQIHSYLYLRRGHYCLPYNYAKTVNEFMSYCDEHQVKYIVVSPFLQREHDTYMNRTREAEALYPEQF